MSLYMSVLKIVHRKRENGENNSTSRWEEARRVFPKRFEQKNGSNLLVVSLTEGTDTILPLNPGALFQIGGREPDKILLELFSKSKGRVIAKLPYEESLEALLEIAVEKRDQNVLIPGLSRAEINLLIEEIGFEGYY